jgi:hypothetical protein
MDDNHIIIGRNYCEYYYQNPFKKCFSHYVRNRLPNYCVIVFLLFRFQAKKSKLGTTRKTLNLTGSAEKTNLWMLVGGRSSMVESKLVELVVAGSSPVDHPIFTILLPGPSCFCSIIWAFNRIGFLEPNYLRIVQRSCQQPVKYPRRLTTSRMQRFSVKAAG